jgi:hypothetical protein
MIVVAKVNIFKSQEAEELKFDLQLQRLEVMCSS